MNTQKFKISDNIKRFEDKVNKTDNCWLWTASLDKCGYGQFKVHTGKDYKVVKAHRYAIKLYKDISPDGMLVLHSCDNPKCVNPDHLRLGTNAENIAERHAKGRDGSLKGIENPNSRLTQQQIYDIRSKWKPGIYGLTKEIAEKYKVSTVCIYRITHKQTYK